MAIPAPGDSALHRSAHLTWFRWALRLIGFGLLVMVLTRLGKEEFLSALRSARWWLVALAAVFSAAHFCAKARRWGYILSECGVRAPGLTVTVAYFSGSLIGAFTPGRIGELVKVFYVRSWRPEASFGTAFGSVVLDRLADMAILISVSAVGAAWFYLPDRVRIPVGVGCVILPMVGLFASSAVARRLRTSSHTEKITGLLERKLGQNVGDFWRVLRLSWSGRAWPIVFWTIAAYVLFFAHFALLARAVGVQISVPVLSWALAVACLGAILPISVSGIGVRDYILVQVFAGYGATPESAVLVSLLYLAVFNFVVASVGLWPFVTGNIDLANIRKGWQQ